MQVESTPRELRCGVRPLGARRRNPHARDLVALVALSVAFLSGCSTSGTGSTTSSGAVGGVAPASDGVQHSSAAKPIAGAADPRSATVPKSGTSVVSLGPKLTRSASLDLRVADISAAAARVRAVAVGLQALVLGEQIGKGGPGDPTPLQGGSEPFGGFGTMTLSVPSDKLETALDQLAKIGTVLQRTTSAQDVTSQYIDTQSRLKTMTASVARVRALMSKAIDLGQVVQLEGEVSRREADLESLQSQMDALNISVERSTLAVSLSTPGNEPVTASGFLAGLRSGWGAFTSSSGGLLIAVGAVLPFAVFFALVGAPIWWSRSRRRASPPPVMPAPAGPSA